MKRTLLLLAVLALGGCRIKSHVAEQDGSVDGGGAEICGDGIDNDADGEVDEDCADSGPTCVAEVCDDAIDNDCDGFVDELCGTPTCSDDSGAPLSAGTVCRPRYGVDDVVEVCDGTSLECPADNMCAGREDELGIACDVGGVPCGRTACIFGRVACSSVRCGDAGVGDAGVELCGDGLDNNGDGEVDEGCAGPCAGEDGAILPAGAVCRPAVGPCDFAEVCTGASALCPADVTTCTERESLCDGVDNDDDGLVDEGYTLYCPSRDAAGEPTGVGCTPARATLCDDPGDPCNGIDENGANGVEDEDC